MDIRLDTTGATDLLSALARLPRETEEEVHGAVVDGAGMVQAEARAKHRFVSRPGAAAEKSILTRFPDRMTGEAFLDTDTVPYLRFIHEGTKPHPIFPKNASLATQRLYQKQNAGKYGIPKGSKLVLRWATPGGGWAFARFVNHPGTKPDQFLYEAASAEQSAVVERFGRAVQAAKQKAGL